MQSAVKVPYPCNCDTSCSKLTNIPWETTTSSYILLMIPKQGS